MNLRAAPGRDHARAEGRGLTPIEVLEAGLSESRGRRVQIAAVDHRSFELSSHPVERLRVWLDDGERLGVVFKRLTADVRPESYGSRREVLVYRHLLAGGRFGAPEAYASLFDEAGGRFWLFLEDVGYLTLKQGDLEEWHAAVRLLAEIHGTYLGRETELSSFGWLVDHGGGYYRAIAEEARQNLVRADNLGAISRYDALMRPFGALADDLARQARTLLHGDIIAHNLAIQPEARIRPIDWESAAVGSPFFDLARLLDGWGADKRSFLDVYLRELDRHADGPVDRRSSLRAFTQCEIVSILCNLRWSVENCRDEGSVNELLGDMEALWDRLGGEFSHG